MSLRRGPIGIETVREETMGGGSIKRGIILWGILLGLWVPGTVSAVCPCTETEGSAASVSFLSRQLERLEGSERIPALIRRGEAWRGLGHFRDAEADFREALDAAREQKHAVLEIVAAQSLGYIHFLKNDPGRAEPLLRSALDQAKALDRPDLIAGCANRLGGVLFGRDQRAAAVELYRFALENVSRADDPGLEAAIYRNLASALMEDARAMEALGAAGKAAGRVNCLEERVELLLSIAAEALSRKESGMSIAFSHPLLLDAYTLVTGDANNPAAESSLVRVRLRSLAAGELAALYEHRGRVAEALQLTGEALSAAQQLRSPELLLRWEWQLGRLLKAREDRKPAIAAYRRAVSHIEAIRQDMPIHYQNGRSSFRETLAPIYLDLAEMLLQQYGKESGDSVRQSLLREARDTVERIKRSEMQDYFRDRCIASHSRQIESLSATTAVLYPIVLADRLELLVDIGGRLYLQPVAVTRENLETAALRFAHRLRSLAFHEKPARQLCAWLIDPVSALLEEHHVNTLVFAPDGALRLIPIAALWDGNRFLVERYAVVTTPGLTLLDPDPLPRGEMSTLLAGMSKPGPVVMELPQPLWDAYRETEAQQPERGVRGAPMVVQPLGSSEKPAMETRAARGAEADQVKQALALPGVEKEIRELSELLKGQVVFNEDFQLERFRSEVEKHPFSVIHIASHGYFGGAPDQNFIMTFDKLLSMGVLEAMVKPKQFAERPVEMIALSACQTAEGDDRSPLGLTGIALKSGARSALGTLWPVSDAAAQALFPAFYKLLKDPAVTKAEALRQAQLFLMHQEEFRHPFFWSPFILVGNWL
ncbi:MAG: CHAT domain-containing protein [Pseudomonadota bacterium]